MTAAAARVLVGGVSQLYQGDLDLGRVAVERLTADDLGAGVTVEDLHYGAVAVAQRLEELRPETLVLVGAVERGLPPGTVTRRRVRGVDRPAGELAGAVADAVTGYVAVDLVVDVAAGLGVLPDRTVTVEVEPQRTGPATRLSPVGAAALEQALTIVRSEVRRAGLFELVDRLRRQLADGHVEASPALDALRALLAELATADDEGRWGATFALRDRLRSAIAAGGTGEHMTHLDWALWWALVEELDRLQALDGADA